MPARNKKTKTVTETIMELAEDGCTQDIIAKSLGIDSSTLDRWIADDEAIRTAWLIGRGKALVGLEQTAFEMALSGDTAVIIFLLKTQCGYRQQDKVELKIPVDSYQSQILIMRSP